ncbi:MULTISPECIES: flagellar transcriptional regulator FlhD [unclassified Enterobacter]|uniref:flagellar transcriptional regulator FlhD n=1 Tax=unclassified Enterobacter TaxID=2608935 RepID=UPI000F4663B9|nr:MULTISPECIES: flagellar transcriptional regulator FlhD [unclassified Enterobacter]
MITSYDERLQSIYVLNLSYLLLAQRMIKQDRFAAGFSLGIEDSLIDILKDLSLPQLIQIASTDRLICRLRIDNESVLHTVTRNSRLEALQGIHAGIILSTNLVNSLAAEEELPNPNTIHSCTL